MLTWPHPQIPSLPDTPNRGVTVRLVDSGTGQLAAATLPGAVRAGIYVCGITPYDATHIGHAATYIAFDLLVRFWRDAGLEVVHASNVTDVDDPLLERATAMGIDWRELARSQEILFGDDMTALGVLPPETYLGAVETIPEVAHVVSALLECGAAYRVPLEDGAGGTDPDLGDVYADLSADPRFGSVAGLDDATMLALFAERGGDPQRVGKRHPLDPLLWRRERPGEPTWAAEALGTGRPGWHIECAVIARRGIGATFDVQAGGRDLVFPHHEMSSSHARLVADADGVGPGDGARLNVHAGLIAYEGEKMSKSLGNLVLVSKLREGGVDPVAIRLSVLAHHYRADWEWTADDLAAAEQRLELWRSGMSGYGGPAPESYLDAIRVALANDLDAPTALAVMDDWATTAARGEDSSIPWTEGAAGVMSRAANALLGVRF